MRKTAVFGILVLMGVLAATAAHARRPGIPIPLEDKKGTVDAMWDGSTPLVLTKEAAPGDTVWIKVKDDSSCSYTGSALFGGRGDNAPGWAVWCFDGGAGDSCSNTTKYGANSASNRIPGCWTHYDAHTFGSANRWHIDTYDVFLPASEDSSMWCGELGDTLTWVFPPGYGHNYNYSLIVNLGNSANFSTANGMTVGGVHLFSVELAYDYCFVEMAASGVVDTATWLEIARFNGVSNPDSTNCRGLGGSYWGTTGAGGIGDGTSPYLCADWSTFQINVPTARLIQLGQNGAENLFVRWRAQSDLAWDDVDGDDGNSTADTRGAWRVDHVYVKGVNSGGNSDYFPVLGAPTRNPSVASGNVDWETLAEDGRSAFSTPLLPLAEAPGGYWGGSSWIHGKPRVVDLWHLTNGPTYPNQGNTCETSNRWVWAANLTPAGIDGNIEDNAWHYRLVSPILNTAPNSPLTAGTILNGQRVTGNIVVYDDYLCIKQISDDVTDTQVRRYEGAPTNRWQDWEGDGFVIIGGCQFWTIGDFDDWSGTMSTKTDSVQYAFEFFDQCNYNAATPQQCMPGVIVASPHRKNTFIVDNLSVGFFNQTATQWVADIQDLFQDTFARDVYIHPTTKENWELFPNDVRQDEDSLTVTVTDINGVAQNSVVMHYRVSTDCGTTWTHESSRPQGSKAKPAIEWFTKALNFSFRQFPVDPPPPNRDFDGGYRTTLELNTTDLPGSILSGGQLRAGTVIEYYLTARDRSLPAVSDTFPNRFSQRRSFIHPLYGTERQQEWPFEVTVLPCQPAGAYTPQGGKRILLANEWYLRTSYDAESDPTLTAALNVTTLPFLSQMFEESLRDLNLKFDRYDNNASQISRGSNIPFYSEPTDADGFGGVRDPAGPSHRYDVLIWATGQHNQYTVTDSSQLELGLYLASDVNAGNMWLAGRNVCEDEKMSGTPEAFNGGNFWVNFVGANLIAGGCTDNGGLTERRFYIEGVNDAQYTNFDVVGGWADCPIRDQPDNQLALNGAGQGTEVVIFQFDNLGHTLNTTAGLKSTQPGAPNKTITTMFDHGLVTSRAARACLTRAIMVDFGVTMPAGSKYTSVVCANTATDVPGGTAQRTFALAQNYPNPFNPNTRINYSLPKDNMKVELAIFDVSGREVVKLVNRMESGEKHEVYWNGKNTAGQDVASGVYFYKLKADDQLAVKKMVLIK